jgi:nitroimidazol reductase NimA-like FMN-containing flavoprotein (pyridoxamine 5'-phosphate oxidase superfamily)
MHSRYMTLATADADGVPWASPVWYARPDEATFLWVSDPEARHSRNIAANPRIALVIFDSTVTPSAAQALYVAALAEQTTEGI